MVVRNHASRMVEHNCLHLREMVPWNHIDKGWFQWTVWKYIAGVDHLNSQLDGPWKLFGAKWFCLTVFEWSVNTIAALKLIHHSIPLLEPFWLFYSDHWMDIDNANGPQKYSKNIFLVKCIQQLGFHAIPVIKGTTLLMFMGHLDNHSSYSPCITLFSGHVLRSLWIIFRFFKIVLTEVWDGE